MSPQPNFFVIGAPKAATTDICRTLSRHPDIFMSRPKELFYFSALSVRPLSWDNYLRHFADATGQQAIGEGSTNYSLRGVFPGVPQRIAERLPEARIIYAVREPISRIESHWMESRKHGLSLPDIDQALREDASLIEGSRYWYQLEAYLACFPAAQIKVVFYEDYCQDSAAVIRSLFDFLGVREHSPDIEPGRAVNASVGALIDAPLTSRLRGLLSRRLRRRISGSMPALLRRWLQPLLKQRLDVRRSLSPASREWALNQLREDALRLLHYCGRPPATWQL